MALEKTAKDMQIQHAQCQETLLNLAKGQQEMMTLLVTKKKTKKRVVINMGRRFKGHARQAQANVVSSKEKENQDEDVRRTRPGGGNNHISEDEDYTEEQYPPADEKYKQLED